MEKVHFMLSLGLSTFLSFLTRGVYEGYQAPLSFWLSRRDTQHVNLGHLSVKDSGIGTASAGRDTGRLWAHGCPMHFHHDGKLQPPHPKLELIPHQPQTSDDCTTVSLPENFYIKFHLKRRDF